MPQNRNSEAPPEAMTWKKASPILAVAAVFDALRYMFLFFWFFGPAMVGLYCTAEVGDTAIVGGLLAKGCVAGAVIAGVGSFAIAAAFGTVMAMAVGFLGWLTVTFIIFVTDKRTFGENPISVLWLFEGIGASVFIMAWGVYRSQIKLEKATLQKWHKEHDAAQLQERQQQAAQLMQQAQETQFAQDQEAANEAEYESSADANNAEDEIPDEVRKAA